MPSGIVIIPSFLPGVGYGTNDTCVYLSWDPWTSVPVVPPLEDTWSVTKVAGVITLIIGFGSAKYSKDLVYSASNITIMEPKPDLSECAHYFCERLHEDDHVSISHPYLETSKSQQLVFLLPLATYLNPVNGIRPICQIQHISLT